MRKILMSILGVLMLWGVVSVLPVHSAYAAGGDICDSLKDDELKEAAGCNTEGTVTDVFQVVVNVIISVMGIAAVGVIMYGGFLLMTSTGDAAKVAKGRRVIIYAIVGLVVAILAYVIVNFVSNVTAPVTSGQTAMVISDERFV